MWRGGEGAAGGGGGSEGRAPAPRGGAAKAPAGCRELSEGSRPASGGRVSPAGSPAVWARSTIGTTLPAHRPPSGASAELQHARVTAASVQVSRWNDEGGTRVRG